MTKKIIIIIPYFGKLLEYFPLWLKTAGFNTQFNWLLFLDDKTHYDFPENIQVEYTSFQAIKEHIISKFDFEISLETPYKLCDFKPAYGYIFNEYIKGYDFWGYGDIDLLYGNLSNFITDDLLAGYDRILPRGHLSLFRNNETMNKAFIFKSEKYPDYKQVFSSVRSFAFDEHGGVTPVLKEKGYKQYNENIMADIHFTKFKLYTSTGGGIKNYRNQFFILHNGTILGIYNKSNSKKYEEFPYIHMQKRKMKLVHSAEIYNNANVIVLLPYCFEIFSDSIFIGNNIKQDAADRLINQFKKYNYNIFEWCIFYMRVIKKRLNNLREKILVSNPSGLPFIRRV
ncbi:hypothetical protein AGMMS49940_20540 [Spirochaetia bacterium]|nr:hypothetical protein AGMMS49940_20540 [Spirochaetia bacterium]